MYLAINKWVIAVNVSDFSGQYLRNHWTLDIGVLGYIGIVRPKEHSPEVWSVPPVTPCICTIVCVYVRNVSVSAVYGHCTVCGNFGPMCECLWLFASGIIRIIFSTLKAETGFIGFCHEHFFSAMCNLKHGTAKFLLRYSASSFCSYSSSSSPFTVLVYKVHDLISEFYFLAIFPTFLFASGMLQNVILFV